MYYLAPAQTAENVMAVSGRPAVPHLCITFDWITSYLVGLCVFCFCCRWLISALFVHMM